MAYAQLAKSYRLMRGKHQYPNPHYDPTKMEPAESHVTVHEGALVPLTDAQFAAFSDKFAPAESSASSVRDADAQTLVDAKVRAALTGQSQNPNVVAAPPTK